MPVLAFSIPNFSFMVWTVNILCLGGKTIGKLLNLFAFGTSLRLFTNEIWKIQYGRKLPRNIGNFLQFHSNVISKWGELPKLYLFLIKLMVQAYIISKIAVLHSHVAKKNGGFNMAKKRKVSIFLHFQTQTISK